MNYVKKIKYMLYLKCKESKEKYMNKENDILATAKITSKGQITIPKIVRNALKLEEGDSVLFLVDSKNDIKIVNKKDCSIKTEKNKEELIVKRGKNNE